MERMERLSREQGQAIGAGRVETARKESVLASALSELEQATSALANIIQAVEVKLEPMCLHANEKPQTDPPEAYEASNAVMSIQMATTRIRQQVGQLQDLMHRYQG